MTNKSVNQEITYDGTVLCTKFIHKKRYEAHESKEKPNYAICPACGNYHRLKRYKTDG